MSYIILVEQERCLRMPDYKEMYFQLAAKVANAIDILIEGQQQGENNYSEEETPVISLKNAGPKKNGSDQDR
jgi:hypothetical protein